MMYEDGKMIQIYNYLLCLTHYIKFQTLFEFYSNYISTLWIKTMFCIIIEVSYSRNKNNNNSYNI